MLDLLRKIIQEVSSSRDLSEALNIMVARVAELTNADACSIFLLDEEHSEHILIATVGLQKNLVAKLKIKLGEGLIGLVSEREEPINIGDTTAHPKFCHYQETTKQPYHAFLGVPITHQRELLGVLVAQRVNPGEFNKDEEAFLITLSAQLAGVIAASKASGAIRALTKNRKKTVILNGTPTVSGVAIGKIVTVYPQADLNAVPDQTTKDPESQIILFKQALKATRKEIKSIATELPNKILKAEGALFDAYLQILDSSSLKNAIIKEIKNGHWAQTALKNVIQQRVAQFESMDDEYLRERSLDVQDLGERILSHLQASEHLTPNYPKNTILVGKNLTPATIAEIPEGHLAGMVSTQGSINSHVAILARALGVPTIMGISDYPLNKLNNKSAIIDGYYGQLYVSPSKQVKQEFTALAEQEQELAEELNSTRELPAETLDGYSIKLLVNTGLPIDVGHALRIGAQGVGLYRTEIPFMTRDRFPSEEEQFVNYHQLLKIFAPRPVVMRTLDIGGDKPLPYFPVQEDNPFLGWRGIRITLDHPEIFLVQVRAMLRANHKLGNLRIMLPMISNINETEESIRLIKQAHSELSEELPELPKPQIGVMIEIPAAVYQAQDLARRVDFLSVGSNDLTQYMLAVDRNNSHVANLYDSLHPAVLTALTQTVLSAHRENKTISICGEMAGDPAATLLLLAMGFDALSMNASQLLKIKWLIRNFSMEHSQQLLEEVMLMDDAIEIRYHLEQALEDAGLAGLIRAGR